MSERLSSPYDPYWEEDISLCEAVIYGYGAEPRGIRARIHADAEGYRHRDVVPDVEHVGTLTGMRVSLHLRPYVLEPDYSPERELSSSVQANQFGDVLSSTWEGMRHDDIGQAHARHYLRDRLSVIWECSLHPCYRAPHLPEDDGSAALWQGVERHLLSRFPETAQLVTPLHNQAFDDDEYRSFLRARGYTQVAKAAFGKLVSRS